MVGDWEGEVIPLHDISHWCYFYDLDYYQMDDFGNLVLCDDDQWIISMYSDEGLYSDELHY